jgi:hypothetical protein
MKDTKIRCIGRPKGATSTCRVKMKDLMKYLTPNATVVVGKTWLQEIGFAIDESEVVTLKVVKETPENTKVEVKDLVM